MDIDKTQYDGDMQRHRMIGFVSLSVCVAASLRLRETFHSQKRVTEWVNATLNLVSREPSRNRPFCYIHIFFCGEKCSKFSFQFLHI